ncbi:MAG: hypothetical protein ACLGIF_01885 [Actinomycetes bacterium]
MSDAGSLRQYAEMQRIIVDVLKEKSGHPVPEVMRALQVEMIRRGVEVPPMTWLEAVAIEINGGRLYVLAANLLEEGEGTADR